jgi:hypothetical protein
VTLARADAVALAEVLDRRSLEACGRGTLAPSRLQEVMGDVVDEVDLLILRDRGTRERIVKREGADYGTTDY